MKGCRKAALPAERPGEEEVRQKEIEKGRLKRKAKRYDHLATTIEGA
jgi:hypothetical protein